MRHGIAGIDDQVEEYLTELSGVGMDQVQRWFQVGDQADVVPDQAQQQLLVMGNQRGQIERFRPRGLAPAEGQKAVGEFGAFLRRLGDRERPA